MYRSDGTRDTHALYNLVLLEDTGRPTRRSSRTWPYALDPAFAEAHYNLETL